MSEKETPYTHGEHPYVLTTLPSIDGNVHGVLNDLIDIQRYINRLIVMIDFIMGASAKGVLMVPENSIPDGMSIDDFTSEYVKANGVIVYKPNNTRDVPFQITSNSTNVGAWEMLSMQMKLIQEISGISGAIQGHSTSGNTPSSLYAQQAQNSQLNYKVLFETIKYHQRQRDEKLLKVIMQYYKRERYISISGIGFGDTATKYEPSMVNEIIDFNLVVSQSTATPLYRQINDDLLKNMLDRGQIDLEMFLSNSSLPFADKLLVQMQSKENEANLKLKEEQEMQKMQEVQEVQQVQEVQEVQSKEKEQQEEQSKIKANQPKDEEVKSMIKEVQSKEKEEQSKEEGEQSKEEGEQSKIKDNQHKEEEESKIKDNKKDNKPKSNKPKEDVEQSKIKGIKSK